MKTATSWFDILVLRSWWVILICLLSLFLYDMTLRHKDHETERLLLKAHSLQHSIAVAHRRQLQLRQIEAAATDPRWNELVLLEHVGVVPTGYLKVIFSHEDRNVPAESWRVPAPPP